MNKLLTTKKTPKNKKKPINKLLNRRVYNKNISHMHMKLYMNYQLIVLKLKQLISIASKNILLNF